MNDTVKCDLVGLGRYVDLAWPTCQNWAKGLDGYDLLRGIGYRSPEHSLKALKEFDEGACIRDPGRYPWWKLEPERNHPVPEGASLAFCVEAIDQLLSGYLSLPGNVRRWSATLAAELIGREHELIAYAMVELRRTKRAIPSISEVLAEMRRQDTWDYAEDPEGRFTWRQLQWAVDELSSPGAATPPATAVKPPP